MVVDRPGRRHALMTPRITKLAYAYRRADQSPSQAVPVSISQGLLLAFDDFFVQLACQGGFFSAGLEARQWWTGWECFWAGRGHDVLPCTRYYDYRAGGAPGSGLPG